MTTGVYILTTPSGRRYVGQSIDIERRIKQHFFHAEKGYKTNPVLGWALKKYGRSKVELKKCSIPKEQLYEVEQFLIDWLEPELNCSKTANPFEDPTTQAKAKKNRETDTANAKRSESIANTRSSEASKALTALRTKQSWSKPETKEKFLANIAAVNAKRARKVKCVCTGEVFNSMSEAGRAKGTYSGPIHKSIHKGIKAVGLYWEYVNKEKVCF